MSEQAPAPKKVVAKTVAKKKPTATKAAAAKKDDAPQQEIKFILSKFSPVYLTAWSGENTICSICRYEFQDPCPHCQLQNETDSCPIQVGACGHKFHLHCLEGWFQRGHDSCPLCTMKWEVANE